MNECRILLIQKETASVVSPFNYEKLIVIFNTEYINVSAVGNPREQKMNFLDLIQKLFGDAKFVEAKKDIQF